MKVFTLFSGYDSQMLALQRLDNKYDVIKPELVGWSEIDRNAITAHNALFPSAEKRNLGDVTKIDWAKVKDFDLLTYSSPCQDFSQAGLQKGGTKGSGTRSSLLWEVEKAISIKRPKYLLMENVAALTTYKFLPMLHQWLHTLEKYGYKNFAKVLNAKDYEVPQNRERIFVVSILDSDAKFFFPKQMPLAKKLSDLLESNVPESYNLSETVIKTFDAHRARCIANGTGFGWCPLDGSGIAHTLTAGRSTRPSDTYIITRGHSFAKTRQYTDTVTTIRASRFEQNAAVHQGMTIRRLTPRECYRLMDVVDADIDRLLAADIAKTNHYKLAGNSIVVSVLYHIFRKMFVHTECETQQLQLF